MQHQRKQARIKRNTTFLEEHPESRAICHIGGSDAPDTTKSDNIAAQQLEMSKEQWDWVKQQWTEQAPERARAADTAQKVSDASLASMQLQDSIVRDAKTDRDTIYRPMEQQMAADAQAFDTPEKRAAAAAGATADVGMQLDRQGAANLRSLSRQGVNPSSGKTLALRDMQSLGEATAKAGASKQARDNIELQGYARRADAVNLGRGLSSSQATSAGLALNAGTNAVNSGVTPVNVAQSGVGMVQGGLGTSLSGMNSAAGIYGNSANTAANVNASNDANTTAAFGTAATIGTMVVI